MECVEVFISRSDSAMCSIWRRRADSRVKNSAKTDTCLNTNGSRSDTMSAQFHSHFLEVAALILLACRLQSPGSLLPRIPTLCVLPTPSASLYISPRVRIDALYRIAHLPWRVCPARALGVRGAKEAGRGHEWERFPTRTLAGS